MSFDYKRAYAELASPAYQELPKEVTELVGKVMAHAEELQQASNLDIPMVSWFEEACEPWSDLTLAEASRIVYFTGHWAPSGSRLQECGAYWKFANLADQVLRKRLGLQPEYHERGEPYYAVDDGFLQCRVATKNEYINYPVGPATRATLRTVQGKHPKREKNQNMSDWISRVVDWTKQTSKENANASGKLAPFFDLSHYGA